VALTVYGELLLRQRSDSGSSPATAFLSEGGGASRRIGPPIFRSVCL